ncbi:MAG TPA: hypothetical protein VMT38_02990 [Terracidiphilus sp.]|nr:hypothetical protein [Terracidiphilus sp.]
MGSHVFYLCCSVAASLPYLIIVVVVVHFLLRRLNWKLDQRRGKRNTRFCPSVGALGMMLLFMQVFVRPTLQYVLETRQDQDVEEDDEGDPESTLKQLNQQLKRVRRGEKIGDLVLRLRRESKSVTAASETRGA